MHHQTCNNLLIQTVNYIVNTLSKPTHELQVKTNSMNIFGLFDPDAHSAATSCQQLMLIAALLSVRLCFPPQSIKGAAKNMFVILVCLRNVDKILKLALIQP